MIKSIKRCPKCGSTSVTLWIGAITGQYFCKNCRYVGPLIIEEDVEN